MLILAVALSTEGQSVTLIYVDSTKDGNIPSRFNNVLGNDFKCKRWNNNNLWCFKIHTFTGPGTFTVQLANIIGSCR